MLVWDGEAAVGRRRARQPELTQDCHAFRGVLGAKVLICKPADPEAKGLVERFNDYLETLVPARPHVRLPGRLQHPARRLARAGQRPGKRVLGCAPADRVDADRAAMLPLPPVAPVDRLAASPRLPRDHYVRLDSNDYSVHPAVIGRRVEVSPAWTGSRCSATGSWSPTTHRLGAAPEHQRPGPRRRRPAAAPRHADPPRPVEPQVELRGLADYDTALGLDRARR